MDYAICGYREYGEEYLCEVVDASRHGSREVNPIVRVLRVLRYPCQHAIYWPDVAVEIPPVEAGCVCRLPFLRQATGEEALRYASYETSLAAALRNALQAEPCTAGQEIILRHMAGEYRRPRKLLRLKPWEIGRKGEKV